MKEKWIPIIGYETKYELSNYGKVKSIKRLVNGRNLKPVTKKEKIIVTNSLRKGYKYIELYNDKLERKKFSLHTFVSFNLYLCVTFYR